MLYQLKYHYDRSQIHPIAELAAQFLKGLLVFPHLKAIVPIPPSNRDRPFQPVFEVAAEVGRLTSLPVPLDYLRRVRPTVPLKDLEDPISRQEELKDALCVDDRRFKGCYILLFDDLYRSGETLRAATQVLLEQGGVAKVFVLALTRTRTRK